MSEAVQPGPHDARGIPEFAELARGRHAFGEWNFSRFFIWILVWSSDHQNFGEHPATQPFRLLLNLKLLEIQNKISGIIPNRNWRHWADVKHRGGHFAYVTAMRSLGNMQRCIKQFQPEMFNLKLSTWKLSIWNFHLELSSRNRNRISFLAFSIKHFRVLSTVGPKWSLIVSGAQNLWFENICQIKCIGFRNSNLRWDRASAENFQSLNSSKIGFVLNFLNFLDQF